MLLAVVKNCRVDPKREHKVWYVGDEDFGFIPSYPLLPTLTRFGRAHGKGPKSVSSGFTFHSRLVYEVTEISTYYSALRLWQEAFARGRGL